MFLNRLKSEQKKLFLELAIKAAEINGEIVFEEKNMLKSFAIEMNIAPCYTTEKSVKDIVSEILEISSVQELKIILFEILGIIMSDAEFDEIEKKFMEDLVNSFGLPTEKITEMLTVIKEYESLYKKICSIVIE